MRILYVEDNTTNVILVQRVANMGRHSVITYDNGEEALENFEHDNPDCVLMDVQLRGELTGLDVVQKLRERGYKMPIIALTAYAMKGDRQRCIDAGCDDYIPKPISVTELVSVFKRFSETITSSRSATVVGKSPVYTPPASVDESKTAAASATPSETTPAAVPSAEAAVALVVETAVPPVVVPVAATVEPGEASPPPVLPAVGESLPPVAAPVEAQTAAPASTSVSIDADPKSLSQPPAAPTPVENPAVNAPANVPVSIEP